MRRPAKSSPRLSMTVWGAAALLAGLMAYDRWHAARAGRPAAEAAPVVGSAAVEDAEAAPVDTVGGPVHYRRARGPVEEPAPPVPDDSDGPMAM